MCYLLVVCYGNYRPISVVTAMHTMLMNSYMCLIQTSFHAAASLIGVGQWHKGEQHPFLPEFSGGQRKDEARPLV